MSAISNIIFVVNYKFKEIKKWYVCGIKKNKNRYYVVVKSNNRNKNKYDLSYIDFYRFGRDAFLDRKEADQALKEHNTRREYSVTYSCGHEGTVRIKGTSKEKDEKIKKCKESLCPSCRNKKSEEEGCIAVSMPYYEYKKHYRDCDTKVGSYREEGNEKTIEVYIKQ